MRNAAAGGRAVTGRCGRAMSHNAGAAVEPTAGEREVRIANPDRVYFPETGATELDLVQYYLSVGDPDEEPPAQFRPGWRGRTGAPRGRPRGGATRRRR